MLANTRIFPLYALVITALALYAWHLQAHKERQVAVYERQFRTILQMRRSFNQRMISHLNQLAEAAQASPSSHNQEIYLHGKSINQMVEAFEYLSTSKLFTTIPFEVLVREKSHEPLKNILTELPYSTFYQRGSAFADSLHYFTHNHKLQRAALAPFFANERQAAVVNITSGHRSDQMALLLFLSDINYRIAANKTLELLANQTYDNYRLPLGSLFPVLSLEGDCHHKGVPIRGVVSAQPYYRSTSNLNYFVQNHKLSTERGLGKFQFVFHEAGMRNLPVKIEVQQPLTQVTFEYFKTFTFKVCE